MRSLIYIMNAAVESVRVPTELDVITTNGIVESNNGFRVSKKPHKYRGGINLLTLVELT